MGVGVCTEPSVDGYPDYTRWDEPSNGWNRTLPVRYWTRPEHADLPIVWLDPEQARAYCEWLGGRLPTSAELEKLARGEDARAAPWEPAPTDPRRPVGGSWRRAEGRANPVWNAETGTLALVPADALPGGRGPYGHFNVIGNALEWVSDGLAEYSGAEATDPVLAPESSDRVARSAFADGWIRAAHDSLDVSTWPPGVRCAFDTEPEMLAR
jgi:formylglycine-generating enzyme required for sulfatase activity